MIVVSCAILELIYISPFQIGGGLWGGCIAVATGTVGVLTAAKDCCPLKRRAHHVAYTVFLALSLISLAVAQLVLVLSATGLSRDLEKVNSENSFENKVSYFSNKRSYNLKMENAKLNHVLHNLCSKGNTFVF